MHEAMNKVLTFHKKLDVSHVQRLGSVQRTEANDLLLKLCGMQVATQGEALEEMLKKNGARDRRVLRAHLLCEELGELIFAMARGDELATLDALADLLYVLLGAALTMDLPLVAAFNEVHDSNMTKEKQADDQLKDRVRAKGPNYRPPNLARLLFQHRNSGDILLVCDNCKTRDTQPPHHHTNPPCSSGCGCPMREATLEEYIHEVEK